MSTRQPPPPYGRPGTREKILRVALELVEDKGDSLRLADVAAGAGVSRQAIYLHFGDRAGLLKALVRDLDRSLGLKALLAGIRSAAGGEAALEAAVRVHGAYAPRIDGVARVLEQAQRDDPDLAAAWRDRMRGRRADHRAIVERLAAEGRLAEGWTVDAAADLFYAVTLPGPWRELTRELGWTEREYVEHMTRLLRALIAD